VRSVITVWLAYSRTMTIPPASPNSNHDATTTVWRPEPPSCSPGVVGFLTEPGSLTDRLIATGLDFSVEQLYLGSDRATPDEADLLGLSPDSPVLARHVALSLGGDVVVVARSLCAAGCEVWSPILDRGGRSLGLTLFGIDSTISRGPLSFATISFPHPLFAIAQAMTADAARFPARRGRFSLHGRALIVQEAFLPALERIDRRA
jgi:chorismate--pyruvate lyase